MFKRASLTVSANLTAQQAAALKDLKKALASANSCKLLAVLAAHSHSSIVNDFLRAVTSLDEA